MTGRPRLSQGQRRKGEMKDLGPTVSPCSNEHCPRDGRLVNISKSGSSLGKKSCIKSEIIYVWKNLLSPPCRDQGCLLCLDRLCLKKKMQNICIFLWSYIFLQALFCNFLFLSSKIMQSTCTPMLLPDRYLISSDSLQKLGMVTPQFSQASKTVHPPEGEEYSSSVPLFSTQGLWHKQISPELWCSRWVVWLWSYVIDSELLPKPTSISITHLLKRVNNPGTEAAKWKAAFTTRSRRCNKAMILTFWLWQRWLGGCPPAYLGILMASGF